MKQQLTFQSESRVTRARGYIYNVPMTKHIHLKTLVKGTRAERTGLFSTRDFSDKKEKKKKNICDESDSLKLNSISV